MKEIVNPVQIDYLAFLRNEKDELTLEMEKFAKEHKVPILNWNAAQLLLFLIQSKRPKRVLEIGTAIGYSSILAAKVLRKKSVLHTIEKSRDNIKLAGEYIKRAQLADKIKIIEGDALKIMPELKKKYDFIFLDADKQDYEKLFEHSIPLLKRNGILFIDNLLWHGCVAYKRIPAKEKKSTDIIRNFNRLFMESKLLKSAIFPIGDGVGIGIKL